MSNKTITKTLLSVLTVGLLAFGTNAVEAADDARARSTDAFVRLRQQSTPIVEIIHEGIRYSESVLPFDGGLLISNFGSETMNPRDDEASGFVLYRKDGVTHELVPRGSGLRKPTGMVVKDDVLFVCDGDTLKTFRVDNFAGGSAEPLRVIKFAADDRVVNALALDGSTLYVSITNSDRIYSLDVSDPMTPKAPQLFVELPGPNGMVVGDGVLYVVTIPHNYSDFDVDHVIYRVRSLEGNPIVERLSEIAGLYDGATLSDDGRILYVSDWFTGSVQAIELRTNARELIYCERGIGPADIAQSGGVLYVPDLVGSRVIQIHVGHTTMSSR